MNCGFGDESLGPDRCNYNELREYSARTQGCPLSDAADAFSATAGGFPLWALLPLVSLPLSLLVACSRHDRPPVFYPAFVVLGFVVVVAWLDLVANEVVAIIETIGVILGISTSILGLTVVAFGNSVGDLVADTAAARGADARMAVASCFGSPLLNDLLFHNYPRMYGDDGYYGEYSGLTRSSDALRTAATSWLCIASSSQAMCDTLETRLKSTPLRLTSGSKPT